MPISVPGRPARLRLLKRMSQSTTEVAPSGGDREVPEEVSRSQGTWVDMTVEDSDDDEKWDPDIRVLDPVESDDDSDSVLASNVNWKGTWVPDQSSRTMCRPVFTGPRKVPTCGATQLASGVDSWRPGLSDDHRRCRAHASCDDGGRFSVVGKPTTILSNGWGHRGEGTSTSPSLPNDSRISLKVGG